MSVRIVFSDAPPEAIQTTTVSSTGAYSYSEPDILPRGTNTGALATCELNSWGLTSELKTWDDEKIGYWSNAISGGNWSFSTPPTITLDLGGQYSVSGLTFRFAPGVGEYCRRIFVEWYREDVVIESGDFSPNSAEYVVNKLVENFDKVKVTLKETNLPNRRAKLEMLEIGIVRDYSGDCITEISIDREVDLMALSLPISSVDVTFQTPEPVELYFFKRQIIDVFLDDKFEGRFFVENNYKYSERKYKITAHDVIGELDQYNTKGGFWENDSIPLETHLQNLSTDKLFKYELSESLLNTSLRRGTETDIPIREAVQQLAFAADAVVRAVGTEKVELFIMSEVAPKIIEARDTYYGGTIEQSDYITSVALTGYSLLLGDESAPYIIIWSMPNGVRTRFPYSETTKKIVNPSAEAARTKNSISVEGCYILHPNDLDDKLAKLYRHYMRRNTYKFTHIVRGEKVGDYVEVTLPWGGTARGHIKKMKITSSGLTVSNTEVLLLGEEG